MSVLPNLACLLLAAASPQAPDVARLHDAIRARLTAMHAEADFPGMTAAAVLPGGHLVSVAVGVSDLETKRTMAPGDRMLAGSTGKTFFAALALQLVGEGKVGLDDLVSKHLGGKAWYARVPNARDLTIRHLMTHRSGIPEHVYNSNFLKAVREQADREWTPEELAAFVLDAEPLFPAGEKFSYADTNYILLGIALESATGKKVYDEVDVRFIKPVGLNSTIPSISRVLPGLVNGYSMPNSPFGIEGPMIREGKFAVNPQLEWTGGGYMSSSEDLAKWAAWLYGGDILSADLKAEMLKGGPANTGPGDEYGLGVQIRKSDLGPSHGHGGWFPGYLTEVEYFPEHKISVAVQFNTDRGRALRRRPRAYIQEVLKVLISKP